jgi:adenosylcobinamide kinase/adenosylcobinamide-phosphate guanylyltransferase
MSRDERGPFVERGSIMGESILVLGGARSGKTRLAERLAAERPPVAYLATAKLDPTDQEMVSRVARHRASRPPAWTTREVPRDLEGTLTEFGQWEGTILIDCVTLWISNLILGIDGFAPLEDAEILASLDRADEIARACPSRVVWVSNEVGSGVVPDNVLGRRFRDLQGWANQRLAAACDSVYLCVAGLPMRIK